jgi:Uma2 family endonuclease
MGEAQAKPFISQQEYLDSERLATEKNEYFQGEIFAMSGASRFHNRISTNLIGQLFNHLSGKKCTPYGSDLRVHIPENTLYTYPDITIVCDDEKYLDDAFDTLLNPKIIIEILSKTTKDYDKGSKFTLYRSIASLVEYILIDSEKMFVERFAKNSEGNWTLYEYALPSDFLVIPTIDFKIELDLIYKNVFDK